MVKTAFIALGLLSGLSLAAGAQPGTPAELAPPKLDPKAFNDRERLTLGDTHELQGKGTTGDSASEKLARTDGVICPPPGLDPDIRALASGGGRTPVIPPPGSPGGDPSVQPK
jgi:hypothetical protein